jgi:magnesium chelatase subunit D
MIAGASAPARRDLALARTARALAFLDGSPQVLAGHVRRAADVLGLEAAGHDEQPVPPPAIPPGVLPDTPPPGPPPPRPAPPGDPLTPGAGDDRTGTGSPGLVTVRGSSLAGLADVTVPAGLLRPAVYPEDSPDSMPEYASLREPWPPSRRSRASRGPALGSEPTRGLADIDLVATVFEAVKFQAMPGRGRAPGPAGRGELVIWGRDLRRHRRRRGPDTAVVLVLDHTCHRDWDWSGALAPYLRWAYVRRAVLTIVECGYAGAPDELRADVYRARSVLDRRVHASLARLPGRATPLAHALDLATGELRRQLRHADASAGHSWLVVASDCRGNIPLEASQRRRVAGPVSGEGVADALAAAAVIRSLPAIRRVVLAPPHLTHCAGLPFTVADAMGGIVAETPR